MGATIAMALLATPALAGVLPFEGVFGNVDGCHLYMTGDFPSDDVFLLTPDTFTSYGTGCDFESLAATIGSVFSVNATCSSEGEAGKRTGRNVSTAPRFDLTRPSRQRRSRGS